MANDDFGPVENDVNLNAPELDKILADDPRARKGKAKEVAQTMLVRTVISQTIVWKHCYATAHSRTHRCHHNYYSTHYLLTGGCSSE